jgi:hypothetical protein
MIDKYVRDMIREKRARRVAIKGREVPESIAFLVGLLDQAKSERELDDILFHLSAEYEMAGMTQDQIRTLQRRTEIFPEDVNVWLLLADSLSDDPERRLEARQALDKAIRQSRATNEFVRVALAVEARIARRWKDGEMFEHAIRELIQDAENVRAVDQPLPSDVVLDLPLGLCSSELVAHYCRLAGISET